MNLLEQQSANRRRTWLVMGVFIGFLFMLGAGVDLFVLGAGQVFVPVASLAALGIGGGQAIWSLRLGDQAILRSTGAVPLSEALAAARDEPERLRYRQFENIVEEMAIASGLPKPATYVIPDADPNAFATGRDPTHASIAATDGLLRALNREELQGVVAHEMAHIRNFDIRLMMVVAALVGAVILLADWSLRAMRFGGGRSGSSRRGKNSGGLAVIFLVVWLIAMVLAPLIGRLLAAMISRKREYLADATSAELTRNPGGLASALGKIHAAVDPTHAIKRGSAHLCIDDPLGRAIDDRESAWANLWATHPPMQKRIEALRTMAYQPLR